MTRPFDERKPSADQRDRHDKDLELLAMAEALAAEERLLAAARLLRRVQQPHRLTQEHRRLLALAKDCSDSIVDLLGDPDDGWIRQGEAHGERDTMIYYKLEGAARLTCRIETPIEQSLLVPLLSVLNEVGLYSDWIPSFRVPRLGIRQSRVLQETGRRRCNKLLQILCDVAWPFDPREVVLQVTAVDDIDESGFILLRLKTRTTGVPPPAGNVVRSELQGSMLFRACPHDHEILRQSKRKHREPLILVSFKLFTDPKMNAVPLSIINFVTRTAVGSMWSMFLHVATDVKDQKRPAHAREIALKQEFYQWVASRIEVMLAHMEYVRFVTYLQG